MGIFTLFVVAVALGTDAFSTALGVGAGGIRKREIIIVSVVVCVFHIFMPLIGLSLGTLVGKIIGQVASIVGALVLSAIGLQMLWEGSKVLRRKKGSPSKRGLNAPASEPGAKLQVFNGFWGLIVLSLGVSLDALSAGFGLGTLRVNLLLTVLVFGIVAGWMTAGGFLLGRRVGGLLGDRAQMSGGVVLLIIAARILWG